MPLDAICLSALSRELETRILGGRIDKIQQPERDMLLLHLRAQGENLRLLIAIGTGNARVQLTEASFENPAEPPMFCMLLRKHLLGAHIVALRQPEHERMLVMELESSSELGLQSAKTLVAELIGRSANLILVDQDGRILDCMRRLDFAGDPLRKLLPGMLYRYPPAQPKPAFLALSPEERLRAWQERPQDKAPEQWLLDSFSGLSPLICRELVYRCQGDMERLPLQMEALAESLRAGEAAPYMLLRDGKPMDFSFLAIAQYGSAVRCERWESFSAMLDAYYSRRDREEQQRRRSQSLQRSVKTARDRLARKLSGQRQDLKRTEG